MSTPPQDNGLEWRGTVPFAPRFGDVYYSVDDPQGEVRHTFLDGTNFKDLCRKPRLCVAETGFGTGLNFLEAWAAWSRDAAADAQLTFLSVEAHPMDRDSLRRAHAAFPEHETRSRQLIAAWPGAVPGVHRIRLAKGRVRLILLIGDAAAMFTSMNFRANAWFLDGFAPSRNPDMWSPEVLSQIARNSAPGARLATFTAAGEVRRGLIAQGFSVEKRRGFGRKRDCVAATYSGQCIQGGPPWHSPPDALPRRSRIAIIGDGIAGRAIHRALMDTGRDPIRLAGPLSRSYAASTLPRALIAPKLIRGDQPFATFWRQAFTDAVRELDALDQGDIWSGPRGLIMASESEDGMRKLQNLRESLSWPPDLIRDVSGDGETPRGLFLSQAGAIDPTRLLARLCPEPSIEEDVAAIERRGGQWSLLGTDGRCILLADAVVLACGAGASRLLPDVPGGFGMRVGSGQCLMMRGEPGPDWAVLKNGYVTAADPSGRFAIGSTASPRAPLASVDVSDVATEELLRRHNAILSGRNAEVEAAWTGLRCDTGDHLPLVGPVQDPDSFAQDYAGLADGKPSHNMTRAQYQPGLYTMTALGARGFQGAFLAADIIASQIDGNAVPVNDSVLQALAPSRFQIRAIMRRQV